MRAAVSVVWVGVRMFSLTKRPLADMLTVVTSAVLPRIWLTVVKFVPSEDTWMSASRVFQSAVSPLAWAFLLRALPASQIASLRLALRWRLSPIAQAFLLASRFSS